MALFRFSNIINLYEIFILATPEKIVKKQVPAKILDEKPKDAVLPIKIMEEEKNPDTFDVAAAEKTNKKDKKGRTKITPVYHYCIFCPENKKGLAKITRHWYDCHSDEKEVKEILALGKQKTTLESLDDKSLASRSIKIDLLKQKGDFRHNQAIYRGSKQGKIVPRRRYDPSKETVEANDFTACTFCLASIKKIHLPKHLDKCSGLVGKTKPIKRNIVQKSQVMMKIEAGQIGEELGEVLSGLKVDHVAYCIMHDNLILHYGQFLLDKQLDTEIHRYKSYIKKKLRITADILIALRKYSSRPKASLESFFTPDNFDTLCNVAKAMTSNDKTLKMGFTISDLCGILKGIANRRDDDEMWRKVHKVNEMYKDEWASKVSSRVRKSKKRKRLNKVPIMPKDDDIKKLANGLIQTIKDLLEEMKMKGANEKLGNELIGVCLVYFILFNRKRCGEVMWILRKNFEDAKKIDLKQDQELFDLLSKLEKRQANRHLVMKIIGKHHKAVPCLMPTILEDALTFIHDNRTAINIPEANQALFPNPGTLGHKDPYPLVRKFANKFDLVNPNAITSTRLRHQFTTQMQLVNCTPNEMKWVADHLGHTLGINEMVYRDLNDMVELTKMSSALEVAEQGELKQFKGKNFSEIKFDPSEVEPEDMDEVNESDEDPYEVDSEGAGEISDGEHPPLKKKKCGPKKTDGRKKYANEFKTHVLSHFKKIRETGGAPDQKMCQAYLKNLPDYLQGSAASVTWQRIKDLVYNNPIKKRNPKSRKVKPVKKKN